jgi:pilus assembly protein TadC
VRGRFGGGEVLEDLGLTVDDLRAGREAGQSLAETAAASGVSEADLVDALVAQATERAEAALDAGRIDADRAAEILDGLDERITERVNAEPGERGPRGPRGDLEETTASF